MDQTCYWGNDLTRFLFVLLLTWFKMYIHKIKMKHFTGFWSQKLIERRVALRKFARPYRRILNANVSSLRILVWIEWSLRYSDKIQQRTTDNNSNNQNPKYGTDYVDSIYNVLEQSTVYSDKVAIPENCHGWREYNDAVQKSRKYSRACSQIECFACVDSAPPVKAWDALPKRSERNCGEI